MYVLLAMINGMMMPPPSLYWAHRSIHVSKTCIFMDETGSLGGTGICAPSGAWLSSTMKAARSRQRSLEIGLSCSRTRLPKGT